MIVKRMNSRQLLRENQKKELALLEEQKAVRGQMQKLTGQLSENSVQIEKTENKIQLLQHQYNVLENLRRVNTCINGN